ncbi:hypothetical protein MPTK1_2g01250 [Marchantia polymorpha subsp. ruderalis]|uniref:Uncharacterized protein n=1 Tax=Marchantia polymorpha TaxID=3197 RepID=A0A2R6X9B3_MARPO|nr:hypothetical protein MARPO_0028s0027 [Marchantia polymorpha]BBN00695.1 hypothetical protein Mp_2g01250 [Marchantia polymorpha subsp. ruderalis]|eukprot:PTQ42701.1 hypothetical protein MARPO_0028s0027 [Marchantia polymorpha]
MHDNYNKILTCVDILSVALAVGLAMEDGPRTRSIGSESGEDESADSEGDEEPTITATQTQEHKDEARMEFVSDEEPALVVDPMASPKPCSDPQPPQPPQGPQGPQGPRSPERRRTRSPGDDPFDSASEDTADGGEVEEKGDDAKKVTEFERSKAKVAMEIKDVLEKRQACESDLRAMAVGGQYAFDLCFDSSVESSDGSSKDHPVSVRVSGRSKAEHPDNAAFFPRGGGGSRRSSEFTVLAALSRDESRGHGHGLHSNTERELEAAAAADRAAGARRPNDHAPAPAPAPYGQEGLHSNTERELEAAAAARGASGGSLARSGQAGSASAHGGRGGLHSNTERELEAAAAAAEAGRYGPRASVDREEERSSARGGVLHSNTERELVAAAAAVHAHLPISGPYGQNAAARPSQSAHGGGIHSNTERELVAAASAREAGISFSGPYAQNPAADADGAIRSSGASVLHSNSERELEAAASARDAADRHEPPPPSRRASRDAPQPQLRSERRLSEKDLIGTSIAAALHINPAHYMGTQAHPSAPAGAQDSEPKFRRERKLSQRDLVGSSYAKSHRALNSDASGLHRQIASPPPNARQNRKMSQNDLLGLAHAAVRPGDREADDGAPAERPRLPQAPSARSDAHSAAAAASHGPRHRRDDDGGGGSGPSNGASHGRPQHHTETQTHSASSAGTQTSIQPSPRGDRDSTSRDEDSGSQYPYNDDFAAAGSGQRRNPRSTAQRDLNNARRYRPYEAQGYAAHSRNSNEEPVDHTRMVEVDSSGARAGAHHASSGFRWTGASAPGPDPDPDDGDDGDDGDEDGSSSDPLHPGDDDDIDAQLIPDDYIDDYPPPLRREPSNDDETDPMYDPQHVPQNSHSHYSPFPQFFAHHPPVPLLPAAAPPPPPPPDDDFGQNQVGNHGTPHGEGLQPRDRAHQSYLRIRLPGDRLLHHRPKCGLLIVSAMRRDKNLPVDRRKDNRIPRTPGRVDINFSPRTGDIILRHVRLPGQGAVEIWNPGLQTQDGDSLIRFKLDPWSYDSNSRTSSNLIIVKAKGYISFEKMWIYMGRAINSVTKAEQRVLGVGAMDGRTVYAR